MVGHTLWPGMLNHICELSFVSADRSHLPATVRGSLFLQQVITFVCIWKLHIMYIKFHFAERLSLFYKLALENTNSTLLKKYILAVICRFIYHLSLLACSSSSSYIYIYIYMLLGQASVCWSIYRPCNVYITRIIEVFDSFYFFFHGHCMHACCQMSKQISRGFRSCLGFKQI